MEVDGCCKELSRKEINYSREKVRGEREKVFSCESIANYFSTAEDTKLAHCLYIGSASISSSTKHFMIYKTVILFI